MPKSSSHWFDKQPVGVRAALITAIASVAVALITLLVQWRGSRQPALMESYVMKTVELEKLGLVSFVGYSLDSRLSDLEVDEQVTGPYKMHVRGDTYPVFIFVFHNDTDRPAIFTSVELEFEPVEYIAQLMGIELEPFAAIDVYTQPGLQQLVPPLMLPSGEVGAIHVRLREPKSGPSFDYGFYQLTFRVGDDHIPTPKFLWTPY